jgi:hypothetical protein
MTNPITDAQLRRKLDEHLAGIEPFDALADTEREQADLDATALRLAQQDRAGRDWLEAELGQSAQADLRPMPDAGPIVWLVAGFFIAGLMLGGWIVWGVLHTT